MAKLAFLPPFLTLACAHAGFIPNSPLRRPLFNAKGTHAYPAASSSSVTVLKHLQKPTPFKDALIPALSYGSVALASAGAAALALPIAGSTAALVIGGSVALPTVFTLAELALLGGGARVGRLLGGERADQKLTSLVNEVAARAHFAPPAYVFEIPTNEMNAFAAGFNSASSCVAVTSGLRKALTETELKAVVAHEMGHLLARDTSANMHMAAAIAGLGGLFSVGRHLVRADSQGSSKSKKKEDGDSLVPLGLGLMATGLTTQFAAHLLKLSTSRRHEFAADAVAKELYGGDAIISALSKIHASAGAARRAGRDKLGARGGMFAHMYIANPEVAALSQAKASRGGWLDRAFNLLSTHPTLEERVDAIKRDH